MRFESMWLNLMLNTVNRGDGLKPVLHVFGKKTLNLIEKLSKCDCINKLILSTLYTLYPSVSLPLMISVDIHVTHHKTDQRSNRFAELTTQTVSGEIAFFKSKSLIKRLG